MLRIARYLVHSPSKKSFQEVNPQRKQIFLQNEKNYFNQFVDTQFSSIENYEVKINYLMKTAENIYSLIRESELFSNSKATEFDLEDFLSTSPSSYTVQNMLENVHPHYRNEMIVLLYTLGEISHLRYGIKIGQLSKYLSRSNKTMTEICEEFKSITAERKLTYCEYLMSSSNSQLSIDTANVFISYSWLYSETTFLDSLQVLALSQPDAVVWIDIFCHNQHCRLLESGTRWLQRLAAIIYQTDLTLVMFDNFQRPISLTRSWCLFEVVTTIQANHVLSIAMPLFEQEMFLDHFFVAGSMPGSNQNPIRPDIPVFPSIEFEQSQCREPEDHRRILSEIQSIGSFETTNRRIQDKVLNWFLLAFSESSLYLVIPGHPNKSSLFARYLWMYILSTTTSDDIRLMVSFGIFNVLVISSICWMILQDNLPKLKNIVFFALLVIGFPFVFMKEYGQTLLAQDHLFSDPSLRSPDTSLGSRFSIFQNISWYNLLLVVMTMCKAFQRVLRVFHELPRIIIMYQTIRRYLQLFFIFLFHINLVLRFFLSVQTFTIFTKYLFLGFFTYHLFINAVIIFRIKYSNLLSNNQWKTVSKGDDGATVELTEPEREFQKKIGWNCLKFFIISPICHSLLFLYCFPFIGWFSSMEISKDPFWHIFVLEACVSFCQPIFRRVKFLNWIF